MLQQLYKQMLTQSTGVVLLIMNEYSIRFYMSVFAQITINLVFFFFFVSMVLKVWHHRKCGSTYLCCQLNRHMSHYSRKTNT